MPKTPLFLCLLAALIFQGRLTGARACQYCRLAATDPEAARMAASIHARDGSFPLDSTLNQFQGIAPSATLTVPPPADDVATHVVDLPPTAAWRIAPPPVPVSVATAAAGLPPPVIISVPAPASPVGSPAWADAGLLGLAAGGGWFLWRTRRVAGPVS